MEEIAEHGECRSVRLSPEGAHGVRLTVLDPYDRLDVLPVTDVVKRASRPRVVRACAAALRASHPAGGTRSAVDARMHVLPYQLEPALAVLHGEATRLLLADDVGLGKTVQAGLILTELRARQALRRALVITPAGLRDQWAAELRERFHLDAAVLDAGGLAAMQRSLPPWVNPWSLPGVAIVSIDLLKRPELLPQLEYVIWDVVIVDEAHHASRGTDRRAAVSLACQRARVVVLVTATPHSGERTAFEDLCSLGAHEEEPSIRIFRRTRGDVWAAASRRTRVIRVRRRDAERRLDAAVRAYTARVWRESDRRADRMDGARLAMVVLRKRALSGPASLARSLARRLAALGDRDSAGVETQLPLDFRDSLGGELIEEDREPTGELAAPGLPDDAAERRILATLVDLARAAIESDSKGERIAASVCAAHEPVIVFTEYRDTLDDLRRRLEGRTTVVLLHGAMLPYERRDALGAFEKGQARVLLATDAAAEGLNLHRRCRWVIHHEVPWSPVRIEQRNGRVDRLGQTRRVHVWHLIAAGTEEEDVLARLARRSATAARDLGNADVVAHAVFDGRALPLEPPRRHETRPLRGERDAARVELLRRLSPGLISECRPIVERASGQERRIVAIFRVTVVDSEARLVSSDCVGIEGPDLGACHRDAAAHARFHAGRQIAIDRAFARTARRRTAALDSAILAGANRPLQTSLFDRHATVLSEYRQSELGRARSELSRTAESEPRYTIRVSLVGGLRQRRRR